MSIVTDEVAQSAWKKFFDERSERFNCQNGVVDELGAFRAALEAVAERLQFNDNDEPLCCNGQDCGCMGATKGEYRAYLLGTQVAQCTGCGGKPASSNDSCAVCGKTAELADVRAWETDDGRVISANQKATALRDGGASASSVKPYSNPLVGAHAAQGEAVGHISTADLARLKEHKKGTISPASSAVYSVPVYTHPAAERVGAPTKTGYETNARRLKHLVDMLAGGGATSDEQVELSELLHDAKRWAEPAAERVGVPDELKRDLRELLDFVNGKCSPNDAATKCLVFIMRHGDHLLAAKGDGE